MEQIRETIKELLKTEKLTSDSFVQAQRKVMRKMKTFAPSKVSLLRVYHKMSWKEKEEISQENGIKHTKERDEKMRELLVTRPVRSLSGIVNISVLTKPYPCPGRCTFCPSEEGMPKSYLKSEPAAMRAFRNNFDPKKQVEVRLRALSLTGHPVEKIELRIVGGSWSSYPEEYQREFIKELYDACNESSSSSLTEAQERNERANHKVVGLSIETRPDLINEEEIKRLREFGVTSVELGVQSTDDEILKRAKRGHGIRATAEATGLLKEAGFKLCYQIMPNLPGATIESDLEVFKTLFSDQRFQPDYLKIYPMMVMKGTEVYQMWQRGEYQPYSHDQLKELLKEIKRVVPEYVRIQRLMRDIPAQEIAAGTTKSNMREIISKEASCRCIRCREVRRDYSSSEEPQLFRREYLASGGRELFLSFESSDQLYSLLRLRISSKKAIVRELHTYGKQIATKTRDVSSPQHRGFGKRLLQEAERIVATEFKELSVISAVGVRDYYRKMGYQLKESYMVKKL